MKNAMQHCSIRISETLFNRVNSMYDSSKNKMNFQEAIRYLLDLGIRVHDAQNKKETPEEKAKKELLIELDSELKKATFETQASIRCLLKYTEETRDKYHDINEKCKQYSDEMVSLKLLIDRLKIK